MLIGKYFRIIWYTLFVVLSTSSFFVSANTLEGIRVWPSPDETRIVIDLNSEANYSYFTLSSPYRLVVDLKNTNVKAKLPLNVKDSKVLTKIRKSSPPSKNTTRLVFELKHSVTAEVFKLAPTPGGQYGHRLVMDLPHSGTTNSTPTPSKPSTPSKPVINSNNSHIIGNGEIVVAIDAGHGGEDPGSIGPTRKYEKHATLAISKKVVAQINAQPGMRAVMTRSGDYFVNLNKRTEIARKNKSHLLVSIHADSFRSPQPRGGSVFVLNTRRANTEIGRWVEKHEKQSELLGGAGDVLAKNSNDRNVSQTLLDLQFSHSQKEGYKLAKNVLSEMGKVIRLHKKEPVNASLAVLKSPDIPSILIETGFISNPTEEKQLFQRAHQDKIARSISKAIIRYLHDNPPQGTLLAAQDGQTKHKVRSGESLSLIAKKYGTTMAKIKSENNLKSTSLKIGQVLVIPSNKPVYVAPKNTVSSANTSSSQARTIITHKVRSGEYLGKIASKYKVTTSSIRSLNKLKSDTLFVGQKLKVSIVAPVKKHTVKRGEFLGKIASKYGVSVSSLRKANKLRSDELAIGQVLIIPTS
ncbi:LysM peptidoglycan-binding domain-containing protein [Aliivibrio fischeri]|uniref:LysM peptidoglycan-binding domain-containing protein n=1 Tax=Aliivibrio fischeri TaxID=668 RepID=UPI00080E0CB7|nr:LysM peptidoglycan-binding domain-containing protein [Aliivibrio fischeri]MUJ24801.1 LysM peptidoglycan-binding domain-containing protein [Aliivibrio fischeri]MUK25335.1 LysM peptidoglycan-binding domain-containing protein [Aliivibrio fischeri]MUK33111.1 LysM peptidoglycan-binding domain-containing protein [Aliivibrio fischeri]OCH02740.1 N-acetylmuramoyl-L-alanine amidase [Aliivibrio fischeri]OED51847.1 N-acetylmuramoyl-L-alanine amidase [Aliivibrio fischeri]